MKRIALLLSIPVPAFAWESEAQDLRFEDEYDVFSAVEYDSGYLPADSPVAVRFFIDSAGGAYTQMDATSQLTWPDALTHEITGVPASGYFDLLCDLTAQAEIYFDIFGYTATIPVWSQNLYLHDSEEEFEPLLLKNGSPEGVSASSDGEVIGPFEYGFDVFTGVELLFALEGWPRASAALAGRRIETNGNNVFEADTTTRLDVPEENPGWVDMTSTYVAWLDASLDIVLEPSMSVCVDIVGCFEVASFEIPVPMVGVSEERPFEPVLYQHPLPSILPPFNTAEVGEVAVGNLANLQVPITNVGLLDLEGYAWIEGDTQQFSVYPEYFYASPEATDGLVVTYNALAAGETSATLIIESNDPVRPRIEIPLRASGFNPDTFPDDDGGDSVRVKTCGCSSAPSGGLPALAGLLALALVRRRRG
jgi:MYXO-CTERM domain-containing protein